MTSPNQPKSTADELRGRIRGSLDDIGLYNVNRDRMVAWVCDNGVSKDGLPFANLRALLAEIDYADDLEQKHADAIGEVEKLLITNAGLKAEIAELRAVIQRVRNAPAADVSGPVYDAGGEQLHRNLGFNKGLKYAIDLLTPKPLDEGAFCVACDRAVGNKERHSAHTGPKMPHNNIGSRKVGPV
jgi:hypothetical protein